MKSAVSLKKVVIMSSVVGFAVPIFWGMVGFIMFNAPNGPLTDLYYALSFYTCPPMRIPDNLTWGHFLMTPFLNAALYGVVASVLYGGFRLLRAATAREGR